LSLVHFLIQASHIFELIAVLVTRETLFARFHPGGGHTHFALRVYSAAVICNLLVVVFPKWLERGISLSLCNITLAGLLVFLVSLRSKYVAGEFIVNGANMMLFLY
jgi:hypothetical protein